MDCGQIAETYKVIRASSPAVTREMSMTCWCSVVASLNVPLLHKLKQDFLYFQHSRDGMDHTSQGACHWPRGTASRPAHSLLPQVAHRPDAADFPRSTDGANVYTSASFTSPALRVHSPQSKHFIVFSEKLPKRFWGLGYMGRQAVECIRPASLHETCV